MFKFPVTAGFFSNEDQCKVRRMAAVIGVRTEDTIDNTVSNIENQFLKLEE